MLIVASVGTYLLLGSHAATPYVSTTADSGTLTSPATKQACSGSSDGNCVQFGSTTTPTSGTLMTFGQPLGGSAYWHSLFLGCATYNSPNLTTFNITATSPCWDSGDGTGTYRTDLCSSPGCGPNTAATESGGGWYQNGQDSCTSIPINIQAVNTVSIEPMFMEPKSYESQYPPWVLSLKDVSGTLDYYFGVLTNQSGPFTDAWMAPMTKGQWHTISVCEHAANTASGKIYGLWLDGVKQTLMNNVATTGFPTISPADTSIPIDINAYGNVVDTPFTFLHGAPVIQLDDTNTPPMPPWGWTGAPQ